MHFKKFLTIPEVRDLIDNNTNMPKYKIETKMKAEPLTKNFPLVGSAFDYFIRFYLKRRNLQTVSDPIWNAEIVCNTMADSKLIISPNHALIDAPDRFMFKRGIPRENEKEIKYLIKHLVSAQNSYHEYLNTGVISEETLKSCFLLARIETSMNGKIDSNFDKIEQKDIEDLRNLTNVLSPDSFSYAERCVIKPSLKATFLPKITEADLIIDDTIIDVKVTKTPRLTREIFRQVAAYFILYNYDGATNFALNRDISNFSINKMGVYFARHGILYKFNAKDVFLPSAPKNLVPTMFSLIKDYYFESGTKKYDPDFQCYR